MELSDAVQEIELSNQRILKQNSFEGMILVSTRLGSIYRGITNHLGELDIKYKDGPSPSFPVKEYHPEKNIVLIILRQQEIDALIQIDKEIALGVGYILKTSSEEFPHIPDLHRTIIVPPKEDLTSEQHAIRAVYCAATVYLKNTVNGKKISKKDQQLAEKLKEISRQHRDIIYSPYPR